MMGYVKKTQWHVVVLPDLAVYRQTFWAVLYGLWGFLTRIVSQKLVTLGSDIDDCGSVRSNDAHCQVQQLQMGAFSSPFTKK